MKRQEITLVITYHGDDEDMPANWNWEALPGLQPGEKVDLKGYSEPQDVE